MHGFVDFVAEGAVGAVDFFLFAEGDVADGGPFGLEGFDGLLKLLAAFVGQLLEAGDDVEFLGEVGLFLFVNTGIGFFLAVEEGVAGGVEAFPHGIAHFVGDGPIFSTRLGAQRRRWWCCSSRCCPSVPRRVDTKRSFVRGCRRVFRADCGNSGLWL